MKFFRLLLLSNGKHRNWKYPVWIKFVATTFFWRKQNSRKINQLLDAIVLYCFYVFMKGLIQFSGGVPIQNICPNYEVWYQITCPNYKMFQLELCQLRGLPVFQQCFLYKNMHVKLLYYVTPTVSSFNGCCWRLQQKVETSVNLRARLSHIQDYRPDLSRLSTHVVAFCLQQDWQSHLLLVKWLYS